jgi:hypothetical protein
VFGNSRQFFLMRQNEPADLDDMGRAFGSCGLTELTKHAILSYRTQRHLPRDALRARQLQGNTDVVSAIVENAPSNPVKGSGVV